MTEIDWPTAVAALFVAILGVGRLSRLITYDLWPPAMAVRDWWDNLTKHGEWSKLIHCQWCLTPWLMLVCLLTFAAGLLVAWALIAWFAFWGWLALSYLASMVVARDEPRE
jgi:hypothetical protein